MASMTQDQRRIIVLIPAYKPDARMVSLCAQLRAKGLDVLLVDDGGGPDYAALFAQAEEIGCLVERHAVNLGKGRALKTGINAAMNRYGDTLGGIITADADGQHTCEDIGRVRAAMLAQPDRLIMGSRAFTGNVPFKSRAGNAITRHVYRYVTGIRCHDTQTGLRGLPARALGNMLTLHGERYEYEMTMLLRLRDMDLPLTEVPIETIYINDNEGSHFRPLRDALRIYSVIFRFMLSSILSFLLDYTLYWVALSALDFAPWLSYALARVLSSLFNYTVNRTAVFRGRGGASSLVRYYLLAAVQLAVGATLVEVLGGVLGIGSAWVKIPVDIALFFLSFIIQREYVFRDRGQPEK